MYKKLIHVFSVLFVITTLLTASSYIATHLWNTCLVPAIAGLSTVTILQMAGIYGWCGFLFFGVALIAQLFNIDVPNEEGD